VHLQGKRRVGLRLPAATAARVAVTTVAAVLGALGVTLAGASSASGASPSLVTGPASQVGETTAVVSGTASSASPGLYLFEYGTTATFSDQTALYVAASPGDAPGSETALLSGLEPATTYYYRLVAVQGAASTDGPAESFTTSAAPPPSSTTTTTSPAPTAPSSTAQPGTTTTTEAPRSSSASPASPGPASPATAAPGSGEAAPPIVPVLPTHDGQGYWLATSSGTVLPYGDAPSLGQLPGPPSAPIVGLTPTPTGGGYWLVASDGAVYPFGDAQSYGQVAGSLVPVRAVSLTSTPDGKGYWITADDGSVYAYGDAHNFGSAAGVELPALVVGLAPTPDGQGYWEVLTNGAVLNFGDAPYFGSAGGRPMAAPVVGIASTADGQGYWEMGGDGTVYALGDARPYGSAPLGGPSRHAVAITPTADGGGYWVVASDGSVYSFGDAVSYPAASPVPPAGAVGLGQPVLHTLAGVPQEYVMLGQEAAGTCPGLPWEILAAIAKVESNFGTSDLPGVRSGTNSAGAAGPMQMGIGGAAGRTFYAYDHPVAADRSPTPRPPGADPPSPYDPADALFAAARDLCTNGGGRPETLNTAILAYNHAQWYADEVETLAASYAGTSAFSLGTSPAMSSAVRLALSQIGVPYVWGGSTPGAGFDCSGLVKWAYGLSGIALPRTSYAQWAALPHLPAGAPLEVGDLLFFEPGPEGPGHVGIYIGGGLMVDAPHTGASVRVEPYDWPSYVGAALP
jgi:cell wall-associated NlpC family hydrolase